MSASRTFKTAAHQLKAIIQLTPSGLVNARDAGLLWLVALGIIRRPIVIRPLPLKGCPVIVRPWTTDMRTLKNTFWHGYHRPPIQQVNTILDLGANVGYVAADFATRFPTARITAVEMDAENYELLVRNTSELGVDTVHAAVWTHEDGVSYDATLDADAFAAASTETPTVRSVRVDTLISQLGGSVDYVKMDIEGGESELITADATWLNSVSCLKVELHVPDDECARIASVLEGRGFCVTRDTLHLNTFSAVKCTS
jgi:FkbM family methyltransferase